MIGILGESVVLGYIVPALNAPVILFEESFEQLVGMQPQGVPRRAENGEEILRRLWR